MLTKIKENFKLMWMVSCSIILVIPVVVNSILNIYMHSALKKETIFSNELIVNQVQRELEIEQDDIFKMKSELLVKPDVLTLSSKKGASRQYPYEINAVYQNLMGYHNSLEHIRHYYIYFPNIDTVISSDGVFSARDFYQKYYSGSSMSWEAWQTEVSAESNGRFLRRERVMEDGNIGECMLYYSNLKLIGLVDTPVLCVSIDYDYFQTILDTTKVNESEMVFVLDKDNNFLIGNALSEQLSLEWLKNLHLDNSNSNFMVKYNNERYELNYCTGNMVKWKYVKLSKAKEFWRQPNLMNWFSIASVFLSLILGFICIWEFIKINYTPMQQILTLFRNSGSKKNSDIGEYKLIEENVKNVLAQKKGAEEVIEQQKHTLQEFFLVRLLKGEVHNIPSVEEATENIGISLVSQNFIVIAFYIEDYGTLFGEDEAVYKKEELTHFILKNIMEELFAEFGYVKMVVVDHIPVLILNFTDNFKNGLEKKLTEKLDYAHGFIDEHFSIIFREGISESCSGIEELERIFSEAIDVMEYRVLMDSDEVVFWKDMPQNDTNAGYSYGYSAESERKLIVAIQNGNGLEADEALTGIFQSVLGSDKIDSGTAKYFLFDIGSTMLKVIAELHTQEDERHIQQIHYVQQLIAGNSVSKIQDGLRELCQTLCRQQKDERHDEKKISIKVKKYIEENYSDVNLNVSAIGPVFGLVPKYLSKKFKAETNVGLLEYINSVRIDKAKQLIVGTNLKFEEIAEKTGYTSLNTFMRVFKKNTGMTPGVYREKNQI